VEGKIKNVNAEKNFGFIVGRDGHDYLFHKSAHKNCRFEQLEKGTEVTFEDAESDKGRRAEDVYLA
jgi:cold shock CspA family protein